MTSVLEVETAQGVENSTGGEKSLISSWLVSAME
jgi:hypothetical protein